LETLSSAAFPVRATDFAALLAAEGSLGGVTAAGPAMATVSPFRIARLTELLAAFLLPMLLLGLSMEADQR
jgi:hypothetical protein